MLSMDDNGDDWSNDERTSLVSSIVRTSATGLSKLPRKYGSTSSHMNNGKVQQQQPGTLIRHRVLPGDTLQGIALRYQTTMENVKRINKLWSADGLFLREYLLVPAPTGDDDGDDDDDDGAGAVADAATPQPPPPAAAERRGDVEERSVRDYLGSLDDRIEAVKLRAQKLHNISQVLKEAPETTSTPRSPASFDRRPSQRLRLSLSDVDAEFGVSAAAASRRRADHSATVVLSSSRRRSGSALERMEQRSDTIYEL